MIRDFSVQNKENVEEVRKKIVSIFKLKNKKEFSKKIKRIRDDEENRLFKFQNN